MPIPGIKQPEWIVVDETVRLRKFDGVFDFALDWYRDEETVRLVDGVRTPYTEEKLYKMYEYLNAQGELYFIEVKKEGEYVPIGDVAFWKEDMPIVIGEASYRGRGIGAKVVACLVERGKELGYDCLKVNEIYCFNKGSQKCFERNGFVKYEKTKAGDRYMRVL